MVHDVYIPLALLVVGVLARFYDGVRVAACTTRRS